MDPLGRNVALKLKGEIVGAGLRQRDVARAAGIEPDRLSKILHGDRSPKPGEVIRVVNALVRLAEGDR